LSSRSGDTLDGLPTARILPSPCPRGASGPHRQLFRQPSRDPPEVLRASPRATGVAGCPPGTGSSATDPLKERRAPRKIGQAIVGTTADSPSGSDRTGGRDSLHALDLCRIYLFDRKGNSSRQSTHVGVPVRSVRKSSLRGPTATRGRNLLPQTLAYPNFPVRYSSVLLSFGLTNMVAVGPHSTSSPT
jgi:hypothetical protein